MPISLSDRSSMICSSAMARRRAYPSRMFDSSRTADATIAMRQPARGPGIGPDRVAHFSAAPMSASGQAEITCSVGLDEDLTGAGGSYGLASPDSLESAVSGIPYIDRA